MEKIKDITADTSQFAKDVELEVKRITWPSKDETVKSTMAVIVISVVFAAFLGGVDYLFSLLVRFILS